MVNLTETNKINTENQKQSTNQTNKKKKKSTNPTIFISENIPSNHCHLCLLKSTRCCLCKHYFAPLIGFNKVIFTGRTSKLAHIEKCDGLHPSGWDFWSRLLFIHFHLRGIKLCWWSSKYLFIWHDERWILSTGYP